MKLWLYANKEQKLGKLMYMLNIKLVGHYRYYGISFNSRMISNFKQQVRELLFRALNRRSQLKSYNKEEFYEMMKYYHLALPRIYVSLFD
jgi:hypothetical protein